MRLCISPDRVYAVRYIFLKVLCGYVYLLEGSTVIFLKVLCGYIYLLAFLSSNILFGMNVFSHLIFRHEMGQTISCLLRILETGTLQF